MMWQRTKWGPFHARSHPRHRKKKHEKIRGAFSFFIWLPGPDNTREIPREKKVKKAILLFCTYVTDFISVVSEKMICQGNKTRYDLEEKAINTFDNP